MKIYKRNEKDNNWENSFLFGNNLPKIISKNKFKFLCSVLHLPVSDDDLEYNALNNNMVNDNEENNSDEIPLPKTNTDKADQREKVLWYINNIMDNSKKYIKLGRDITIDETMVFLEADVL